MPSAVQIQRPAGHDRLITMQGTTARYAVEPDGIYIFGLVVRGRFRAARGRSRYDVASGDVVAWEPGRAHSGVAVGGRPWEARLVIVELPDVRASLADPELPLPDLELPRPVVRDRALAAGFEELHRALADATSTLAAETLLADWLRALAGAPAGDSGARRRAARSDPRLLRACELIRENLERNLTLDELSAAAGTSRFGVSRLFRAGLGMPPHRFQLAQRLKLARALLERGADPSETAARSGFFDQSHLHRHLRRTIGITPGRYAAAFATPERSVRSGDRLAGPRSRRNFGPHVVSSDARLRPN